MTPAPRRPVSVRPAERAARLRSSQRKHKDKVKHRIIDLESRLSTAECKLERALSTISTLSDQLRAVVEQNRQLQQPHRCRSGPLTSNPSSSRAAQISEAPSRKQREHVQELTLPWENDANPEDFSWSSAFLEGVNTSRRRSPGPVASSRARSRSRSSSVPDGETREPAGSTSATHDTSSMSTASRRDAAAHGTTPASTLSPAEEVPHESYDSVDIAAMRDWIDPKFDKPYGKPGGDRIQPAASLFALMDFISS